MRLTDPDPIPELKRDAAAALVELLEGWNAYDVAVIMGTDEPRVSDIRRGKLQRFSLEMLIRYLTRLRRRVTLQIVEASPPPRPRRG
jgi:hypothetical protein